MEAGDQEIRLKLIVVGKKFVGKTAVVQRYVQGTFKAGDKATIGVDFFMKELYPRRAGPDGKLPKLQNKNQSYHSEISSRVLLHIWDIAGQDTYIDQLSAMFCRGAIGAVLICDVTSPESFDALRILKKEIDRMVHIPDLKEQVVVPTVLVCNKVDEVTGKNPNQKAAFSKEAINQFAEELEVDDWFYTSAKTGEQIDNVFDSVVTRIFADKRITENPAFAPKEGVMIKKKKPVNKKSSGCPASNCSNK